MFPPPQPRDRRRRVVGRGGRESHANKVIIPGTIVYGISRKPSRLSPVTRPEEGGGVSHSPCRGYYYSPSPPLRSRFIFHYCYFDGYWPLLSSALRSPLALLSSVICICLSSFLILRLYQLYLLILSSPSLSLFSLSIPPSLRNYSYPARPPFLPHSSHLCTLTVPGLHAPAEASKQQAQPLSGRYTSLLPMPPPPFSSLLPPSNGHEK